MVWEFNGEAWDTEEKILGEIEGYTCALTLDTGEQIDVAIAGANEDELTLYLQYRDFDENLGEGSGPLKRIPYEQVTKLFVY